MNDAIGKTLKALRKNNGLSQETVANYLNISQSAYSRIETGESNSWTFHFEKLRNFYKIKPATMLKNMTKISLMFNFIHHSLKGVECFITTFFGIGLKNKASNLLIK